MSRKISYKDIEKNEIDYVIYFRNDKSMDDSGKLHMVDLTHKELLDGHGNNWNEGAFGNCKIFLYNQKITDALYLVTKHDMEQMNQVPFIHDGNMEKFNKFMKDLLDDFASIIVRREPAE